MALKHKNKTKKKLTIAAIALVILVPMLVLLFVIVNFHPGKISTDNIVAVTVTSPESKSFTYYDIESFRLYADIFEKSAVIETPANELSSYKVFRLDIDRKSDDISCEILLTDSPDDCLMRIATQKQTVYKNILPEYASLLLTDENFSTAYTYYMPPTAKITVSGKTGNLAPFEMDWNYRKCDGSFYPSDVMHFTSAKIPLYDYSPDSSAVEIEFELVPDAVSVQIFDGADSVYSGKYGSEEYKSFTYNRKTKLEYIFTAEWYESSSAKYHGKAIYKAEMNYILTPVGLASSTKLENGEFMVLSIYNTARDEALTLENGNAVFYENDGVKLMYYSDSNKDTEHQVTLTVTDQSKNKITQFVQTEPVKITSTFELHESLPDGLYTANYDNPSPALAKILQTASVSGQKMWNGKFENPVESTDTLIKFGTKLTQDGENAGYSCFMLVKSDTQDVKSMGDGRVVFSGELEDYGKAAVIDHGIGIFTFYSNLDSLNFASGDSVRKSDVIAKLNIQSGAALQYGVLAGGRFIDPEKLNECLENAGLV